MQTSAALPDRLRRTFSSVRRACRQSRALSALIRLSEKARRIRFCFFAAGGSFHNRRNALGGQAFSREFQPENGTQTVFRRCRFIGVPRPWRDMRGVRLQGRQSAQRELPKAFREGCVSISVEYSPAEASGGCINDKGIGALACNCARLRDLSLAGTGFFRKINRKISKKTCKKNEDVVIYIGLLRS